MTHAVDHTTSAPYPDDLVAGLAERAGSLASQRPLVARVLSAVDDPDTSASQLGELVGRDPALAARLMRLANSAAYGLSGRVTSTQFAVSAVGFSAVRALAVTSAVDTSAAPPQWLELTLLHAFAAAHVAGRLGAPHGDAFCAGLLSDLARPLLLELCGPGYVDTCAGADHPDDLTLVEAPALGMTHTDAARLLFTSWAFPSRLVAAVVRHHEEPHPQGDPLDLAVRAGHEVACRLQGMPARLDLALLTDGAFDEADLELAGYAVAAQAADLHAALV